MKLSLKKITVVFVVVAQGCVSLFAAPQGESVGQARPVGTTQVDNGFRVQHTHGPVNQSWRQNNNDQQNVSPLITALNVQNINKVKEILEVGINSKDVNGNTPLILALNTLGNAQVLTEAILGYKCESIDINAQDNQGQSALMYAIMTRKIELVNMILKRENVVIDSHNKFGVTALSMAIMLQSLPMIQAILAYSKEHADQKFAGKEFAHIDINYQSKTLFPVITQALMTGNVEIVKALLEFGGVDLQQKSLVDGFIPLEHITKGLSETKNYFLKGGSVNKYLKNYIDQQEKMIAFLQDYMNKKK